MLQIITKVSSMQQAFIFLHHIIIIISLHQSVTFYRAAALCHFEALQVLAAYGADFTVTNNDQQTAMHLTLPSSNLVCIRFLGQRGENIIHMLRISLIVYQDARLMSLTLTEIHHKS